MPVQDLSAEPRSEGLLMGLQFAIGREEIVAGASWSYGGFNDFRRRLALEIGIHLDRMEGFGGRNPGKLMPWSSVKGDLVPLLHHSDCDGEMYPDECRRVAPRLREIVMRWPVGDYDRRCGQVLADAMAEVAEGELVLVFT